MSAGQMVLTFLCEKVVWGDPMLCALLLFGVTATVRTRFFPFRRIGWIYKKTMGSFFQPSKKGAGKALSPKQAAATALAATIGTGNIAGVATALTIGGAGAVFWMWISALLGMMTAFSEQTLGVYYRRRAPSGEWLGGAMYYLEDGLYQQKGWKKAGRRLALFFALCQVGAAFGMGNMIQMNTVAGLLETAFVPLGGVRISPLVIGAGLALLLGFMILGGAQRIGRVAERMVPVMAVGYFLGTGLIIARNIHTLPAVFTAIFRGAFGFSSVVGGWTGSMVKQAVSLGIRRGVFSNEAGLGSSVTALASAEENEPVVQGMWGIFTVVFDTIIGCSFTAFAILSSGVINLSTGQVCGDWQGAELVAAAFAKTFFPSAGLFVTVATVFFALSTVVGWSFYGSQAAKYLKGERGKEQFGYLFVAASLLGSVLDLDLVWKLSDLCNGLMAIPNLIGLWILLPKVIAITDNYIARQGIRGGNLRPLLSFHPELQRELER